MDPNDLGSLQQQLTDLRARMLRLEGALEQRGTTIDPVDTPWAPVPAPPQGPISGPVPPPPPRPSTVPRTHPEMPAVAAPEAPIHVPRSAVRLDEDHSLESRIGSQWFNRIGILAVLIGVAWGLKLAFDNHWIGPLGC